MSKWGVGNTNGHTCPPCSQKVRRDDMEKRSKQKTKVGLFVPMDDTEPIQEVDLTTFRFGATTCIMYHSEYSLKDSAPMYECNMDDMALLKYGDNHRALKIAGTMACFDFSHDPQFCGPMLFTGPNGSTLFKNELVRYTSGV